MSLNTPPQLLVVQLGSAPEMGGYPLGGFYSKALTNWLSAGGVRPIPEMVQAMRSAYNRMFGMRNSFDKYRCRAFVDYDTGWLNTSCPGDACGLHPEHHDVKKGEGYQFGSHNVDSPMQQVTLLAGLAALHDAADMARPPLA